jgi:hypothetical protein
MSQPTPNLFLVGAMRAGTTALHQALTAHPDVYMSPVKEPAYLADPVELETDSRIAFDAGFTGNRARYLSLFREAAGAAYIGESSTHYTKRPRITGIADRLAKLSPDPRIIYLVRDPIDRTLSHYSYAVRSKDERRPCLDAIQQEPFYCAVSDYAFQIRPYVERFGMERVHLCVLEDLIDDSVGELNRLFSWLGLPLIETSESFRQRNATPQHVRMARGPDALHKMGRAGTYQHVARAVLPARMRTAIRTRLHRPVLDQELRSPAVIDYLRAVHTPAVVDLEREFGRSFPRWTSLRPG